MQENCDILDAPYGEVRISKEDCMEYAGRFHIGSSRFAAGLILTREEYEAYRSEVYRTPLP
jgi:hypothetical protein